jgi:uncharacterized membrane protein
MAKNLNDNASQTAQASETKKAKTKAPVILFGCGGCGCLLALLALIGGVFMIAMAGDSHLSELGPFGFVVTPLSFLIGFISIGLLVVGFMIRKQQNR